MLAIKYILKKPRNRHLYIFGGGSNGKTSFLKYLTRNFRTQSLSATTDFLLTELDQSEVDFYVFEEFNIHNHIGAQTRFGLDVFNHMLGAGIKNEEEYNYYMEDQNRWPQVNVKGSKGRTNPTATFIFLTNIPIPTDKLKGATGQILENFKRRLSCDLSYPFMEKLPREICDFSETMINTRINDLDDEGLERRLKDMGMQPFAFELPPVPTHFGYADNFRGID